MVATLDGADETMLGEPSVQLEPPDGIGQLPIESIGTGLSSPAEHLLDVHPPACVIEASMSFMLPSKCKGHEARLASNLSPSKQIPVQ